MTRLDMLDQRREMISLSASKTSKARDILKMCLKKTTSSGDVKTPNTVEDNKGSQQMKRKTEVEEVCGSY